MSRKSQEQKFKYKPLDTLRSFRLLALEPGNGDDKLVCEHHIYELSRWNIHTGVIPNFEAISYVWGSSRPTHAIVCNGSQFLISENLRAALCQLRNISQQIFVWVDAICIDQTNLKERKMQVALMRKIYSQAEIVSVCLGSENMNVMRNQELLALAFKTYGHFPVKRGLLRWNNRARMIPREYLPIPSSPMWPLLAEFFDNPWFSRIWVIQEVAESKNARLLLGHQEIPWDTIVRVVRWLLGNPYSAGCVLRFTKTKGIQNVLFMNNGAGSASHDPVLAVLQSARGFESSDPRDKVYAILYKPSRRTRTYAKFRFLQSWSYVEVAVKFVSLLCFLYTTLESNTTDIQFWCMVLSLSYVGYSMQFIHLLKTILWDMCKRFTEFCFNVDRAFLQITDWHSVETIDEILRINADYSITTQSLYTKVATQLIERSGKLTALSHVYHDSTIDTAYPSWVPRWDISTHGMEILTALPQHQYNASAGLYRNLNLPRAQPDHLVVEGIRFSTISTTSSIMHADTLARAGSAMQWDREMVEIFGDANCDDKDNDRDKTDSPYPTGETRRKAVAKTLIAGRLDRKKYALPKKNKPLQKYNCSLGIARRMVQGRRILLTENGYVGIGPAAMQKGDLVCVLFGGDVPFVVRSTDTDGMHRLVGESYVHGIMDGEVVEWWRQGRGRKERFVLC